MTKEEASVVVKQTLEWVLSMYETYRTDGKLIAETKKAFDIAVAALRDYPENCAECGTDGANIIRHISGKMRIDIPPGNDSVRASTGFQRDGGDKTERRCNQCIHCGQEMPEGDQVCGYCRRQHGY